jgi:glyoxylase-like metal-dependent hydrolase (beta-lactamase superfamily II)
VPVPFPLKIVNCYLARDAGGWVMIDTGLQFGPAHEAWADAFHALRMRAQDIHRIYLTHAHPDHYGLAGYFQNLSGARVFALDEEIRVVALEWQSTGAHITPLANFLKEHGAPREVIKGVVARLLEVLEWVAPQPELSPLRDGEQVVIGENTYRVIWVPGHADGHLLLHRERDGLLFAGDHILIKISPHIPLWPHLDPNPLRSYLTSLDQTEKLRVRLALPGHRGVIHDVRGRIGELREHYAARAQACWEAAGKGCTGYEVCVKIFPKIKSVDDMRMAMVETLAHLEYLVGEGRLERYGDELIKYRQQRTRRGFLRRIKG